MDYLCLLDTCDEKFIMEVVSIIHALVLVQVFGNWYLLSLGGCKKWYAIFSFLIDAISYIFEGFISGRNITGTCTKNLISHSLLVIRFFVFTQLTPPFRSINQRQSNTTKFSDQPSTYFPHYFAY